MTDSAEKLLHLSPCPFCGKSETVIVVSSFDDEDDEFAEDHGHPECFAVVCSAKNPGGPGGCGASGGYFVDKPKAIAKWNRRAASVGDGYSDGVERDRKAGIYRDTVISCHCFNERDKELCLDKHQCRSATACSSAAPMTAASGMDEVAQDK